MCVRLFETSGGGKVSKVGGGERDKGEKVGEETLTVCVTDSCQENESAVCQPTTHKQTRIQSQRP